MFLRTKRRPLQAWAVVSYSNKFLRKIPSCCHTLPTARKVLYMLATVARHVGKRVAYNTGPCTTTASMNHSTLSRKRALVPWL